MNLKIKNLKYAKMIFNLKCNNIKCFIPLKESVLYTVCAHVFCPACASTVQRLRKCIACNQAFSKPTDMSIKDVTQPADTLLLPPEDVLDEARRSINFWLYQVYEELEIKVRQFESVCTKLKLHNEQLKNDLSHVECELAARDKRIQVLEREVEREKGNYYEIEEKYGEKVKELKKVVAMNEKLKFDLRNRNNCSD